jgi:hypothetical protein
VYSYADPLSVSMISVIVAPLDPRRVRKVIAWLR